MHPNNQKQRALIGTLSNVAWISDDHFRCDCPVHPDSTQSLSVTFHRDDSVELRCRCGCTTEDICESAGIDPLLLQPTALTIVKEIPSYRTGLVAEYKYTDENGEYLYSKLRYAHGKIMFARTNKWPIEYGRGDVDPNLYNLTAFLAAVRNGETVYYVETEEDVETLRTLGITATTSGGIFSWKDKYREAFAGATVMILAGNSDLRVQSAHKVMDSIRQYVWITKLNVVLTKPDQSVSSYLNSDLNDRQRELALYDFQEQVYPDYIGLNCLGEPCLNSCPRFAHVLCEQRHFVKVGDLSTSRMQEYAYMNGVYSPISDSAVKDMIVSRMKLDAQDPSTAGKIYRLIELNTPVRNGNELNSNESIINFSNGLYDIDHRILLPHDPKIITTIQLPCDFDPAATEPYEFIRFMDSLCTDTEGQVDEDKKALLQELIGLSISQIYGSRIKSSVLLYSPIGNTGKSVLLDIITSILGEKNVCSLSIQDLNGRWATAFAYGKRLICVGDQKSTEIRDSSNFKKITGGDLLKAEKKGKDLFGFKFRGLMLMAANNLPRCKDDMGDHMAERFIIIPCMNVIPAKERDPYLREKLLQEKQGIVLWALKGLERFLKNGMTLSHCQAVDDAREDFRRSADSVYGFISDRYEVTGKSPDYVKASDLHREYRTYCKEEGLTPVKTQAIAQKLASYDGIFSGSLGGYDVYRGLVKR